jgi:HipA-like protein
MRSAEIYNKGILAGILQEKNKHQFVFTYNEFYFIDGSKPSISVTMSKKQQVYEEKYLFPLFYNMLSEGVNRKLQSRFLRIDEQDDFGLLLATAQFETIGSISVKPIHE